MSLLSRRWWMAGALLCLALPATAQSFDEQQVALSKRLEGLTPVVTTDQRYEVSKQGFAELLDFQETVVEQGWVSPRGWILQCRPLKKYLNQWVDESQSLTRVYLGAFWLEYWGVRCDASLDRPWSSSDVRRLARAADRAAKALPEEWQGVAPLYAYRPVLAYLKALNRDRSLEVSDRVCVRQLLEAVEAGTRPMEAALASSVKACPVDPGRPPLTDGLAEDAVADTPLAASLETPFLGLNQWVVPAQDMATVMGRSGGNAQVMMDLMRVMPLTVQQVVRQQTLLSTVETKASAQEKQAFAQQAQQETKFLGGLLTEWTNDWPSAAQCKKAADQLREAAQGSENADALNVLTNHVSVLALLCPSQGWTRADLHWLQAAFERTAQALPPRWSPARRLLGSPGQAQTWMADQEKNRSRLNCLQRELAMVREQGDIQGTALLRARARCAPGYQPLFPQQVQPFIGEAR